MPNPIVLAYVLTTLFISSCSNVAYNEHQSLNKAHKNTLPTTGTKTIYFANDGFVNIDTLNNELSKKQREIFSSSISWYATEAELALTELNNKSARQIVDIVNCLKSNRASNLTTKQNCLL